MSSPKYLPSSIRYTKARFRPFVQPLFWVTAATLGLFFFALWKYGKQPNWLIPSSQQPETVANYLSDSDANVTENTQLAPEDLALLADIDNIDLLLKEIELKPTQDNLIDFAPKPQTPAKASKNLLEQLLQQKPTDLLTRSNSSLFKQKSKTSTNPLTTIKPVGNLPSLSDLGQRQQRALAGEDNLRRALDSSNNTATDNFPVRQSPAGVTNASPGNGNYNQFSGQVNSPANPAQPGLRTPVTQPQPNSYIPGQSGQPVTNYPLQRPANSYIPGQPITRYPLQRPSNINNFNRVTTPNLNNNSSFIPNSTNPPYPPVSNNYGLPALPASPNLPTPTTQPYGTQPSNYGVLGNPNFSTPIPQLNNYGTQGSQLPQNNLTNGSNFLYYYR